MDHQIDIGSKAATYGGAATSMTMWGLQISEIAAIVGALVAVLGLVVQIAYTVRKDRRAQEVHRASLEELRNGKAYARVTSSDG